MAARKNRGVKSLPQSWKDRIQAGVIADRMIKCFNGDVELTRIQLEAGKIILGKLEPDLARAEMTGKDGKDLIPTEINLNLRKPKD